MLYRALVIVITHLTLVACLHEFKGRVAGNCKHSVVELDFKLIFLKPCGVYKQRLRRTITLCLTMQELGVSLSHIESRPSKIHAGSEYDFYVDCMCTEQQKDVLVERLKACALRVSVLSREPSQDEGGGVACLRTVSPAVCVVRVEWLLFDSAKVEL